LHTNENVGEIRNVGNSRNPGWGVSGWSSGSHYRNGLLRVLPEFVGNEKAASTVNDERNED